MTIKDKLGTARWERSIGQGTWEGAWGFHAHFRCTALPGPLCAHPPRGSLNAALLVLEVLHVHRHDWFNHCHCWTDSASNPSPFPGGSAVGLSDNPLIMVCSPGNHSSSCGLPKSHLININSDVVDQGLL